MPDDSGFPRSSEDMRTLHRVTLHRIQLHCTEYFTAEFLEQTTLEFLEVAMSDSMAAQLRASITGVGEDRIRISERWPTTWWDAFKVRWFPTFMRWRLLAPAAMSQVEVDRPVYAAVCPHHSPLTGNQRAQDHVQWLCEQDAWFNHRPEDLIP